MTRFSYAWFSAARANARAPRKSLSFSLCTFATKTVLEKGKLRCHSFTRLGGMAEILYKQLNYKILYAQTSSVRLVSVNEIVFLRTRPQQSTRIKLMVYPPSDRARSCSPENKKTPRICRDSGKNMSLSISVLYGRRMVYK